MSEKKRVLFLCTGNSCRSQMAEGFARELGANLLEPLSAGVEPRGVDERTVQVMAEDDVDISDQASTPLTEELLGEIDMVITLCDHAQEQCPALPATVTHYHWSLEDPAQATGSEKEILATFRASRDEIKDRVLTLGNEFRVIEEF